MVNQAVSATDADETTSVQSEPVPKIPRPGLSQSFRRMKAKLFGKGPSVPVPRATQLEFAGNSSEVSPERSAFAFIIKILILVWVTQLSYKLLNQISSVSASSCGHR